MRCGAIEELQRYIQRFLPFEDPGEADQHSQMTPIAAPGPLPLPLVGAFVVTHGTLSHLRNGIGHALQVHVRMWGAKVLRDIVPLFPRIFFALKGAVERISKLLPALSLSPSDGCLQEVASLTILGLYLRHIQKVEDAPPLVEL